MDSAWILNRSTNPFTFTGFGFFHKKHDIQVFNPLKHNIKRPNVFITIYQLKAYDIGIILDTFWNYKISPYANEVT